MGHYYRWTNLVLEQFVGVRDWVALSPAGDLRVDRTVWLVSWAIGARRRARRRPHTHLPHTESPMVRTSF